MKAKNFLFGVWADTHGAYAYAQGGEKKEERIFLSLYKLTSGKRNGSFSREIKIILNKRELQSVENIYII